MAQKTRVSKAPATAAAVRATPWWGQGATLRRARRPPSRSHSFTALTADPEMPRGTPAVATGLPPTRARPIAARSPPARDRARSIFAAEKGPALNHNAGRGAAAAACPPPPATPLSRGRGGCRPHSRADGQRGWVLHAGLMNTVLERRSFSLPQTSCHGGRGARRGAGERERAAAVQRAASQWAAGESPAGPAPLCAPPESFSLCPSPSSPPQAAEAEAPHAPPAEVRLATGGKSPGVLIFRLARRREAGGPLPPSPLLFTPCLPAVSPRLILAPLERAAPARILRAGAGGGRGARR